MIASLDKIASPFARLRALLDGIEPGAAPIDMTIGEPRHGVPELLATALAGNVAGYGKYPPVNGIPELRAAICAWAAQRYPVLAGALDPESHILPLNGSREGLFSAIFPAIERRAVARPAVLMPNPFYQAYLAAAIAGGAEPVFLPATAETAHLPDLDAISCDLWERTAAVYLASPANPQGAVASPAYLARLIARAREHDAMLFLDECYSEIYMSAPPPGGLETAWRETGSFANVAVFNSLSKRSNVPGLRSGFIAGDPEFLQRFGRFRNVACPQVPLPVQHASAALWSDENHAETSRALYRAKFAMARSVLGQHAAIPPGGFFLWLDLTQMGGGEAAAKTFWKGYGLKILPGAYLAQTGPDGRNPGVGYARLALVDSLEITEEALGRLARAMR